MSTVPPSPVQKVTGQITAQTLTYAPIALAGMLAAEQTTASGEDKKQAVVNGIIAGAKTAEQSTNPDVASVSALIDLFASIFNSLGFFKHKT